MASHTSSSSLIVHVGLLHVFLRRKSGAVGDECYIVVVVVVVVVIVVILLVLL